MENSNLNNEQSDELIIVKKERHIPTVAIWVISIIVGVAGLSILPGFLTSFPAIIGNVGIGIGILYLLDKYAWKTIDIIEELKNGNVAVGLLLIAYAIIIAASISAS